MYELTSTLFRELRRNLFRGHLQGWRLTAWNFVDKIEYLNNLIVPYFVWKGIVIPAGSDGKLIDHLIIKDVILEEVDGTLNIISENKRDHTLLTIRIPKQIS